MSIFDVFRRKRSIPSPWDKYYTENDLNINIPNISMYDQILKASKKYPNNVAIEYFYIYINQTFFYSFFVIFFVLP